MKTYYKNQIKDSKNESMDLKTTFLVTGGAGFIGSHLCERLLSAGCRVINIDNFNNFYDPAIKYKNINEVRNNPDYILIEGDILDTWLLRNTFDKYSIDVVVHLAALAGVRKSTEQPLEYVDIDIKGTVNLLEVCRRYAIRKFIFASSSSVYGSNPVPFKESDDASTQLSPYAVSKRAGELFCKTYSLLYNIPIVCLRFFTVYGPRQRPEMAIHSFTRCIEQKLELPVFNGGISSRDYTYIDDIIDGLMASIELDCSFEVINLGNSNSIQLNHLIDLIEKKTGKLAYKRYLPSQQGDMEHTFADITKAGRLLGYKPKISIDEGIERFVKWYRKPQ